MQIVVNGECPHREPLCVSVLGRFLRNGRAIAFFRFRIVVGALDALKNELPVFPLSWKVHAVPCRVRHVDY